jgi:septum formation protein
MHLVLASASARRQELLRNAGFEFEVRPSKVTETLKPGETAEDYVRRVASEKALDVALSCPSEALVLGADTVIDADGRLLGKPASQDDAAHMLRLLSGHAHRVVTGICLVRAPNHIEALDHETTFVSFRNLDEDEIADYVRSSEPFGKAGAYAIQGLASKFVTRISGSYFNVVGLPVSLVYDLLKPLVKATT